MSHWKTGFLRRLSGYLIFQFVTQETAFVHLRRKPACIIYKCSSSVGQVTMISSRYTIVFGIPFKIGVHDVLEISCVDDKPYGSRLYMKRHRGMLIVTNLRLSV